jgi:hypothetical protein
MNPGKKWILAVVALLAMNVIAAVTLMVIANNHDHSRVLPSYKFEAK